MLPPVASDRRTSALRVNERCTSSNLEANGSSVLHILLSHTAAALTQIGGDPARRLRKRAHTHAASQRNVKN